MAEGLLDKANIILTPTGYKAGTMYNVAPIEQPYEDFDFARASVASRVNSSGLVEMVGRTLGSNLVQNGDFSEIGTDLVQNGTFDLGSELVTSTSSTDNWINARGNSVLSVEGDTVRVTIGSGSTFGISTAITTVIGKSYQINSTGVRSNSSGQFIMRVANSANLSPAIYQDVTTDLTLTTSASFTATATTTYVGFLATLQTTGDYIETNLLSVKEVPDWTIQNNTGTDTEITSGNLKIETDGAYTQVSQSSMLVGGNQYKLIYTILSSDNGDLGLVTEGNVTVSIPSSVGTHTYYFTAHSTSFVLKRRGGALNVTIDNVSVQELDPNDYWNLETGWSLGDNQAIKTGSVASNFYQYSVFTTGQTYKLTFTISNSNDGRLLVYVGGNSVTEDITNTSDGTYTFYANSDNVNLVFRNVTFEGSITNVTAKEVIDTNNIPRINYDSNGENGHWLLEPTSTNLITYSEDFSEWTLGSNATLSYESDVVAPDGSLGVYRLTLPAQSSTFLLSNIFSGQNPLALSIYAKSAGTNNNFNLYDGSSSSSLKTATSEWQRFDYIGNGNQLAVINDGDTYTSDIYIWGAQAEALSYATSYIPTLTGSTETRATETANGAGSAELINSTEGVLYAEIAALADDLTRRIITITDGTLNNIVKLEYKNVSNQIEAVVYDGDTECLILHTLSDETEFNKIAFKYKQDDFSLFVNGIKVGTDTSGAVFTPNTLNNLSFYQGSSNNLFGKVKALAVFGEALSDDELEKLTSWSSFNAMATDLGYTIE